MKVKFLESFRFKIIVYTLLSILCTVLTVSILTFGMARIKSADYQKNGVPSDRGWSHQIKEGKRPLQRDVDDIKLELIINLGGWIILAATLFVVYFTIFSNNMVRYLKEISDGIGRISSGDLDTNIRVKDEDELSVIAYSINIMRSRISSGIEKERETERTKNELITNVAHDLKTPLTSIIGYLELLKFKEILSEELKEKYISIATDKAKRLQYLMEELFDYTRYDKDKVKLYIVPIELGRFMEQLVDEFYPEINSSGLNCRCELPAEELWVHGDGELLARGLGNLLSNAIKYGCDGKSIEIIMKTQEDSVRLSIVNYGRIISEEELKKIFDQFYRIEGSRAEHTGGTGLGLAIAKNIIQMHNGTISVQSDNNGTVFTVTLPLENKSEVKNERE